MGERINSTMMKLAFGGKDHKFDHVIALWTLDKIGMHRTLNPGMYYSIGVMNEKNELVAGVLYSNYSSEGMIELSMAAVHPGWCRRGIISGLLYYPFIQLNCHVILSTMKMKNRRVRRLAEGIGFKVIGKIPNWPEAEDQIIYSLRREDAAKWLPSFQERKVA